MDQVILVDEMDNAIGAMEKMEAHKKGVLHRAFSVFIFNERNELLLQQRAVDKYHSGGLLTNTCCSHPKPGETIEQAASRRLQEEMGFTTLMESIFSFIYRTGFENGLTEYEYDHVLVGHYQGTIAPDPKEVSGYAWWPMEQISEKLANDPSVFTVWFQVAFPRIYSWWNQYTASV